ncbi:DeoR/GlpR family DNA-binding transcription regulator [Dongia rigui]|uniref:DeoR/GlpR family DNA-binding transcription regulator n=1 Tax=Dongia rigui TaxID=940149 RepID=A0ABU5E2U3_9PROT|nr:DeoR/GlpR family DNA-binding transcription regulator [Dongia rigui]MDY0873900.1 DeoR/GlpR family DNA-binding transcription regulator [Dongia rigui]
MGRSARNKVARHKRIMEALQVNAAVRVGELAEALGVSGETIRRDLSELGNEGAVSRTFGGAVAKPVLHEPNWRVRHDALRAERGIIAELAFKLVHPGDVLILETGSTVMHLAEALANNGRDLSVITSSLEVALVLGRNNAIEVHLCPGILDAREGSVVGAEAEDFLERYNATTAFVGSTGITTAGLQESHTGIAAVKCTMLSRAKKRVVLLDHSKFDQTSLVTACPLTDFDVMISDRPPGGDLAAALEAAGVSVVT